jgi:hypothetical protein
LLARLGRWFRECVIRLSALGWTRACSV